MTPLHEDQEEVRPHRGVPQSAELWGFALGWVVPIFDYTCRRKISIKSKCYLWQFVSNVFVKKYMKRFFISIILQDY